MHIRSFEAEDTFAALSLFQECVHAVGRSIYTSEQLHAWAPSNVDDQAFAARLLREWTIVATDADQIVGFASLTRDGLIDMMYVSANHQGQGVARRLYETLETQAINAGISQLKSDVSLTGKVFFERMGFSVDRVYTKTVLGIDFENRIMSKVISNR